MGRAGRSLKQTLEQHAISQYSLAIALGLERTNVYRWVHEQRDPTAETVVEIVRALRSLNPGAAENFVKHYIGDIASGTEVESEDDQLETWGAQPGNR
jgi:transcriptional regulator with XRE-family HTH domain